MKEEKLCRSCGMVKSINEFYKRSASRDGLSTKCKSCERLTHQTYYTKKKRKSRHRAFKLRYHYNITVAEFNEMFEEQEGACGICKTAGVKLVVDHDHVTGKVRELLCSSCNHGLGRFNDNTDLMHKAIAYLERHANPNTPP